MSPPGDGGVAGACPRRIVARVVPSPDAADAAKGLLDLAHAALPTADLAEYSRAPAAPPGRPRLHQHLAKIDTPPAANAASAVSRPPRSAIRCGTSASMGRCDRRLPDREVRNPTDGQLSSVKRCRRSASQRVLKLPP